MSCIKWLILVTSLCLGVLIQPSAPLAKETIDWVKFNYPPMYIVEGDQVGQGYMDTILDMLIAHLPQYNHTIRVANLSRIMSEFEQGKEICVASLFKNEERERLGCISQGNTTFLPSVQLVYRAEDSDTFKKFGPNASLKEVLKDPSLILGVSDRMSYGALIDTIVAAHKAQPNVFLRSGEDVGLGLHEMLLKKRIDYTINYPWAARFTAGPQLADQLGFLPLIEAGKNPVHYVICTKTDRGKQIIADVDKLLADPALILERRTYIEKWLPQEGKIEFLKAYNAHFGLQ